MLQLLPNGGVVNKGFGGPAGLTNQTGYESTSVFHVKQRYPDTCISS